MDVVSVLVDVVAISRGLPRSDGVGFEVCPSPVDGFLFFRGVRVPASDLHDVPACKDGKFALCKSVSAKDVLVRTLFS